MIDNICHCIENIKTFFLNAKKITVGIQNNYKIFRYEKSSKDYQMMTLQNNYDYSLQIWLSIVTLLPIHYIGVLKMMQTRIESLITAVDRFDKYINF